MERDLMHLNLWPSLTYILSIYTCVLILRTAFKIKCFKYKKQAGLYLHKVDSMDEVHHG